MKEKDLKLVIKEAVLEALFEFANGSVSTMSVTPETEGGEDNSGNNNSGNNNNNGNSDETSGGGTGEGGKPKPNVGVGVFGLR